jgi:hypothetical protein
MFGAVAFYMAMREAGIRPIIGYEAFVAPASRFDKSANVPAEMHLYAQGGHGYGLRRTELPVTAWPQLVETWLHTIKILQTSAP